MTDRIGTLWPVRTKIFAVCGVLLFVAACSDSGLTSSGPAPLVEKSAAIQRDDAICKQLATNQKTTIDRFKASHPSPKDAEALDFFTNTLLPIYDGALGSIKRVGEPTKDRVDYDAAIKSLDEGLTKFKEEIADDPIKVLNSGSKAFDNANAKLKAYGFTECGKS